MLYDSLCEKYQRIYKTVPGTDKLFASSLIIISINKNQLHFICECLFAYCMWLRKQETKIKVNMRALMSSSGPLKSIFTNLQTPS